MLLHKKLATPVENRCFCMNSCGNLDHDAALEMVIKIVTLTKLSLGGWKMKILPEGTKRPKISTLVF